MMKKRSSASLKRPSCKELSIEDCQSDLPISLNSVADSIEALLKHEQMVCDAFSVSIVDKETICQLHEQFFNDPSLTDCISFPIDSEEESFCFLGETFICPHTAVEYVKSSGEDAYEECTLYLVHSFLHLLGYDDIDPDDEKIMRNREKELMSYLKKNDLCLNF